MSIAKVFQSGNSQAIRIPKELQTSEKQFVIHKLNNCYFLIPENDPWALLRYVLSDKHDDLSFERDQPVLSDVPEREDL